MRSYQILIHEDTLNEAKKFQQDLITGYSDLGDYFQDKIRNKDISQLSPEDFLELLIQTKQPCVFAERDFRVGGSGWRYKELSILGNINFSVPVTIFDNGRWNAEENDKHGVPLKGHLLFTPGALLSNSASPDTMVINSDIAEIDPEKYYALYEKRLLPLLIHANNVALEKNKKAFITLPCLGGGQFAGSFQNSLGEPFKKVLQRLLNTYGDQLKNIQGIYYDPYINCENSDDEIKGIKLTTRALLNSQEGEGLPQLCNPEQYGPEYKDCEFFSMVAWDHVSWPGNDFYIGKRNTDDGVKAAATDTMYQMTGVEGQYNRNRYNPPTGYLNWEAVVEQQQLQLQVKGNVQVINHNGEVQRLSGSTLVNVNNQPSATSTGPATTSESTSTSMQESVDEEASEKYYKKR